MEKILLAVFLFSLCGCSAEHVSAKYHLARADKAFYDAYKLRTKKGVEDERLRRYRDACSHFSQAYQLKPDLFTLYHIDSAIEACTRVDEPETKRMFQAFQEMYIREHPVEAEHGDAGVELLVAE